jgi:uncharacterized membrane protein YhhN
MNRQNIRFSSLLYWLLALSYLLLNQFYPYALQTLHKAAPILFLAILSCLLCTGRLRFWLTMALLFSATGDILLASTMENSFIFGLLSFAIAHLCYAVGFWPWCRWSNQALLKALPLVVILLVVLLLVLPHTAELRLPVLVYMGIISLMAVLAIFSLVQTPYLLIGAFLFVISDSLIAVNKFVIPLPWQHILVMLTYYLAQYYLFIGCIKQGNAHVKH